MNRNHATMRRWPIAAALAAVFGLAACASDVPPPTAQLGASSQAVLAAERANALQYAPVDLQTARDKLAAADAAMRADERTRARRLAEQAQVDAELATVRAQHAVTEQAATAVRQQAVPLTVPRPASQPVPQSAMTPPVRSPAPVPLSGSAVGGAVPMNNGTSWGSGYTYPEVRP